MAAEIARTRHPWSANERRAPPLIALARPGDRVSANGGGLAVRPRSTPSAGGHHRCEPRDAEDTRSSRPEMIRDIAEEHGRSTAALNPELHRTDDGGDRATDGRGDRGPRRRPRTGCPDMMPRQSPAPRQASEIATGPWRSRRTRPR
ncbi:hypothetical protein QJS66_02480 [Kocuria rhizophila]|nr:hypothetical protein QJS66_02480 [Kocuria rhizophila]